MGDAGVHEGAVVADEKNGAVVAGEEGLEPLDALEVEVVGWLVEHQQVWVAQEELGERDAHLPAAGEVLRGLVEVLYGKAESREDLAGAALKLVATEALEAVLGVTILLQQTVKLGAGLGGGDLLLELGDQALVALDLLGAVNDLGKRSLLAGELGLLLQVPDGGLLGKGDGALVCGLQAHENLEEGGLAGTVGADKSPALASVELKRCLGVEGASAKGL